MPTLHSIPEAIKDIAQGNMVIVIDDEGRENEGDLIMAAELITPEAVNFMATHARGLICTSITQEIADSLHLSPMTEKNTAYHGTAFTVSIDAAEQVTTGISSYDRAHTIKLLANPQSTPDMFVMPGHMFPVIGKKGGVLKRPGHTEASIELAQLARLVPAGVICEIMNDDGTMARLPQLRAFAQTYNLKIISIKDLIAYKKKHLQMNTIHSSVTNMPTSYGNFRMHFFEHIDDNVISFALVKSDITPKDAVLTRIHSECFTGEFIYSQRCDCGQQLKMAMQMIEHEGSGIIIYLKQEGRGIGLHNKIKAYELQDQGLDTVQANTKLGFEADLRDYAHAAQILKFFQITNIKLLTNNPLKVKNISQYGINVVERVAIEAKESKYNKSYLATKRNKLNHILS